MSEKWAIGVARAVDIRGSEMIPLVAKRNVITVTDVSD